jgi:transcriptional regulator with XRE-family HTH domain
MTYGNLYRYDKDVPLGEQATLSYIELGINKPRPDNLEAIAKVLQTSADELIED